MPFCLGASVSFFVFVIPNLSEPVPYIFRVFLTQFIRHRRAINYDDSICCVFGTLFAAISDKRFLVGVYLDLARSCRTCTVVLLECSQSFHTTSVLTTWCRLSCVVRACPFNSMGHSELGLVPETKQIHANDAGITTDQHLSAQN